MWSFQRANASEAVLLRSPKFILLMSEILNKYLHSTLQFTKYHSMHYFIISSGRWVAYHYYMG